MFCVCGSTVCECDTVCRCCPMRCRCQCEICVILRRQFGVYCDHCGGFVNAVMCGPISEWTRTGIYPNLDFLHSNQPQQSTSGSDERTDTRRCLPQASPNVSRESRTDESPTDDSLIFQMDDVDFSSEVSTNTSAQPISSLTGRSQVTPNINVLSTRQSQISDMPIGRNVPEISSNTDTRRLAESYIEPQTFQCNPNIILSKHTESSGSEMPISQDLSGCSHIGTNADVSRPRASYLIETQSLCNPSIPVSERTASPVREMPIPKVLPGCSRHNPNESVSKRKESLMTDCPWCKIPSPSNESVSKPEKSLSDCPLCKIPSPSNERVSKHEKSQMIDCPLCKIQSPSNECVSERTKSSVNEMPIPQDLPGCSRYNLDEGISKPEEPQTVGASCMVSESSNEFSSDSLPSLPSTSSDDDSPPSYFKVDSRSPTRRICTSAPAIYDIPEPVPESEYLKQETLVAESTSETSAASHLPELETPRISDSPNSLRASESSSSIETLPSDMPNGTGNINGHPDLPAVCETSASLNNTSVHNTPVQAESAKQSTSQTLSTANSLKLPSPEMSKAARRRKSSESSIETLSRDPANETSEDEHTTDTSPKKDD